MASDGAEDDLRRGARDDSLAPPVREVLRGVLALQLAHRRALGILAGSLGLTDSDVLALALVVQRSELTVSALAAELGLTRGSASLLVTRLERAGLVARLHDAEDRRVVHVRTTGSGTDAARTVRDAYVGALDASADGPEADLRAAADVLRRTAERLLPAAEAAVRAS